MSKKTATCLKCKWVNGDASALKALSKGEADPDQQKRALDWIINNASMCYELGWEPDNERASSFESGRRFVGREIVGLININLSLFKENKQ